MAGGDVVIGARSSSYSMAYAGIGLTADGGATWLLPRVIGLRRTQELAYLGRRLTAEDAERIGLITQLGGEAEAIREAMATEDARSAIQAFLARQTPSITGG